MIQHGDVYRWLMSLMQQPWDNERVRGVIFKKKRKWLVEEDEWPEYIAISDAEEDYFTMTGKRVNLKVVLSALGVVETGVGKPMRTSGGRFRATAWPPRDRLEAALEGREAA